MENSSNQNISFSKLADQYSYFIVNLDDILWPEEKLNDPAIKTLNQLKEKGKTIFFISNDVRQSRKNIIENLKKGGYEAKLEEIYTPVSLALTHLKLLQPNIKKLYIIGEGNLIEEAEKAEFKLVSCIDHAKLSILTEEDISVDAVLVGFTMQFNYYMLTYSSTLIEKGSQFFGVTDEESWRIGARELPGTATFIAAIERVTEQQAKIIGRINHEAISLIVQANSLKQNKCLLIGNKLETDILYGINTGVHTCLIPQYGSPFKINKLNDVKKSEILPNYMCNEFSL